MDEKEKDLRERGFRDGLRQNCAASNHPAYTDGFLDGLRKAKPELSEIDFRNLLLFLLDPYQE